MDLLALDERPPLPLLVGETGVRLGVLVEVVVADHQPTRAVETVRGVPDVRDVQVGLGDAAVDPFVGLPPAAAVLQPDLPGRYRSGRPQGRDDPGVQVAGDPCEHVRRQGRDAVVRAGTAARVLDLHPVGQVRDLLHLGRGADAVATDRVGELDRYGVHAADRLEHRHGLLEAEGERDRPAEPVAEHLRQGRRAVERRPRAGAGVRREAPALGPRVDVALPDVAELRQEVEQAVLVRRRQPCVQRAGPRGLRQQFADVAVGVGARVRPHRGLHPFVEDVRAGVLVDEQLDGHAQLAAVVEGDHPLGDAGRPALK